MSNWEDDFKKKKLGHLGLTCAIKIFGSHKASSSHYHIPGLTEEGKQWYLKGGWSVATFCHADSGMPPAQVGDPRTQWGDC